MFPGLKLNSITLYPSSSLENRKCLKMFILQYAILSV